MKIITVCGSLKYQKEMMEIAEKMAKHGNCMITPVYPTGKYGCSDEEKIFLRKEHFEKIKLSDSILVVNVDNYIGEDTKKEIEYAKSLGKEIIYYIDLIDKGCKNFKV